MANFKVYEHGGGRGTPSYLWRLLLGGSGGHAPREIFLNLRVSEMKSEAIFDPEIITNLA